MTLTCACASKLSEAKASLGAMGRAQQWHFQEKGAFNPDWLSMEPIIGAPAETESYRYSLQMVSDRLYGFAIAQDPTELRNVVIALAPTEEIATPETRLTEQSFIMCISKRPGEAYIPLPTYEENAFTCALGTESVN